MIQKSNNSFSTVTSIRFGAKELSDFWWNCSDFVMPTVSMSPPEYNTRSGAMIKSAPDTVTYSEIVVSLLMDKDWKAFDMIWSYFLEGLDVTTGKFSHYKKFDLWVEFLDGAGKIIKKFWFYDCMISDISGILVTPSDDQDSIQNFDVTFSCLYFDFDRSTMEYLDNDPET